MNRLKELTHREFLKSPNLMDYKNAFLSFSTEVYKHTFDSSPSHNVWSKKSHIYFIKKEKKNEKEKKLYEQLN